MFFMQDKVWEELDMLMSFRCCLTHCKTVDGSRVRFLFTYDGKREKVNRAIFMLSLLDLGKYCMLKDKLGIISFINI